MDSVQKGESGLGQFDGNGLICGDHKLLNDLMSEIPLGLNDLLGFTLKVEDNFGLGQVEIEASPFPPLSHQERAELPHCLQRWKQRLMSPHFLRIPVHQDFPHGPVGETGIASDHALEDFTIR